MLQIWNPFQHPVNINAVLIETVAGGFWLGIGTPLPIDESVILDLSKSAQPWD